MNWTPGAVPHGQTGCAEVDSMTEAVAGKGFLLGCISCKRREEVPGCAVADWHYKAAGSEEFIHIFQYEYNNPTILHEDFEGRLEWKGTMGTKDVQTGSIFIHNVTYNDTGTYLCTFHCTLYLPLNEEHKKIYAENEAREARKAARSQSKHVEFKDPCDGIYLE
ncbi:sodium channel subunit beta-1-like isoform X2 [Carassius carassius]|uniref:sodium channel subunit beta-1-like isoform X2 n=1 Tax=Carassius carassius TaxID=217509 RepID=UPI0028690C72|nr:sodium channel subunit beta-1-like isoform X2 [Carassius carassius]